MSLKEKLSHVSLNGVEAHIGQFADQKIEESVAKLSKLSDIADSISKDVTTIVNNSRTLSIEDINEINNIAGTELKNQFLARFEQKKESFSKSVDVVSDTFENVRLIDYKLASGRQLNVAFNKEVPLLSEKDRKTLQTTTAGQKLADSLSPEGSITNALSVSLTEKNGSKTVAGLAAGGTLYNPGSDGSLYITTSRKLSSGQLMGIGHFTQEDQSALVTYKLNKEGIDYERLLSAGINNEKLGAVASVCRNQGDYMLNAGVGVHENQFGIRTKFESEIDSQTKVSVSAVAEKSAAVEAKLVRETAQSTLQLSCLLKERQAEVKASYQKNNFGASVGTVFEDNKETALVATIGYQHTF